MNPVIVDTDFLVALFEPSDRYGARAAAYLRDHRHALVTVSAVVVEACLFLSPQQKRNLLGWIRNGGMAVADVPVEGYAQLELTLLKYADREVDFADAALIWLANQGAARKILTVDRTDFGVFRLKGGRRFELVNWM